MLRRGDRAADLRGGQRLRPSEPGEVGARGGARGVQPPLRVEGDQPAAVGGRERRQAQVDEHRHASRRRDRPGCGSRRGGSAAASRSPARGRRIGRSWAVADAAVTRTSAAERTRISGRRKDSQGIGTAGPPSIGSERAAERRALRASSRPVDSRVVEGSFAGKRGLVLGVANRRSIAWAIASRLARGRRGARLHLPGRADREERPRARGVGRLAARHRVRRPLRRGSRARLRRGRRGLRRRARPAGPLGRVRGRGGSRGPLHGHAARPLLARARRLRLLARRLRRAWPSR